ncbi:hypothetical protein [Paractinoplanes maris]|uniref:hypothetical protein n=1 Tax=Paractinoplanes maris TaxID=1734446 RepID=UPI0020227F2C|nr:hypothetical protein [Actinoplanes maris]
MADADTIRFPLETILSAGQDTRPLDTCPAGHLVVAGRTHWQPIALADLQHLVCRWVEHDPDD